MTSRTPGRRRRALRAVVEVIGTPAGQHREVGVDTPGPRLQEQMIVLRGEGEALQIPAAKPHEGLAALELQIDLIADEACRR